MSVDPKEAYFRSTKEMSNARSQNVTEKGHSDQSEKNKKPFVSALRLSSIQPGEGFRFPTRIAAKGASLCIRVRS
jgi:hypothetical protein